MGLTSERLSPHESPRIRVAFILPGLHRVSRGAEVAFESVAQELNKLAEFEVTAFGSGFVRPESKYRFVHISCIAREKFEVWPKVPPFRSEYSFEEFTFAAMLFQRFDPRRYDVVFTCSYPFLNWVLRSRRFGKRFPRQIFVTQNGDWPVKARNSEFRWFDCDGLICTNPVYFSFHNNCNRWPTWLIPNGVDLARFEGAIQNRNLLGLPRTAKIILIISALIPSKRVIEGIRAVAPMSDIHLVVAGDGPLREQVDSEGKMLLGARFSRITLPFEQMPDLYRAAHVLLHMSQVESFGNVYTEALAAGLPIVAHDWASTRWIFEGQAVLVDTNDPCAVRDGLRLAFEQVSARHAESRKSLVKRRFTWEAVAAEYAKCIRKVFEFS